jgi:hypothetical protein
MAARTSRARNPTESNMEINVTKFVQSMDERPLGSRTFFASVAELGPSAGKFTWANAKAQAEEAPFLTTEAHLTEARAYFREFGAWSKEELAAMDAIELNALLIQEITAQVRETGLYPLGEEYEKASEAGQVSGNLYLADDGEIYFYMGH